MNCLQLLIAIAIEVHILDHLQKSKSNLTKHTNYKASSKLRKGLCETNCDIKKKQKSKSIQSRFSCYSLYGWWCIMRLFPPFVCRRRWGYPFRSLSISSFPVRSPWWRPSCLASFHSCSWKQGTSFVFFLVYYFFLDFLFVFNLGLYIWSSLVLLTSFDSLATSSWWFCCRYGWPLWLEPPGLENIYELIHGLGVGLKLGLKKKKKKLKNIILKKVL